MSIEEIFESRKDDPRWNTSYPLSPGDWARYRVSTPLSFDHDKELSFYIHIPFCKQLCSFCEYTRMICPDESLQDHYIDVLSHDIEAFKSRYNDFVLKGFDIGGGTPTSLSESNFSRLLDTYDKAIEGLALAADFEPSIEGTFNTLSVPKLQRIVRSGIHRLSLGIQTTCSEILASHHREKMKDDFILRWMNTVYGIGIKKINLDLMYGLKGQNADTIQSDLETVKKFSPQQVTLYELRTNMINLKDIPSKIELYEMYRQYYHGLSELGYHARFGQNTFSLDKSDLGVSSYLRSRMVDGVSYKGFGISAQSMSKDGISYNCGKNDKIFHNQLKMDTYSEEFTYSLPSEELASKYIAISGYYGSFSLDKIQMLPNGNESYINKVLNFFINRGMLESRSNRIYITEKGFKYYGAILSMFYQEPT